jgi:hypothetical protein
METTLSRRPVAANLPIKETTERIRILADCPGFFRRPRQVSQALGASTGWAENMRLLLTPDGPRVIVTVIAVQMTLSGLAEWLGTVPALASIH